MKIKLYLFWIVGLFAITYLGSILLPLNPNSGLGAVGPQKNFNYWLSLAQWDGGNFLNIASNGYSDFQNFAFFPLYPFLIKIVGIFTLGNKLLSAIIISNICFILFLTKFYSYVSRITTKKKALSTFLVFLFYPVTFYCLVVYSESLFLFLAIYSLSAIHEKKFLKASIFASLASLTRFIGISLVILVPVIYIMQVKFKPLNIAKTLLFTAVSSISILLFSAYSFYLTSEPFKFVSVQKLWQRNLSDPVSTTFPYIWSILTLQTRPVNDYLDLILTLIFLFLLMLGVKKIPRELWIFSLLAILIPTYTGTLTSMPRYLLPAFGVFIIIGDLLERKPNLTIPVYSLSLALECLLAALFINGFWVA